MNIVICEDSISDRHKLEKVITKFLIKNNLNSEIILSTNNSADVLNYANKNNQITLYFLDINLHEKFISGIDIANELGVSLDYLVGTHIKKKKNYQECRKYENQIIEKVKCLNKMQLLYVLDTIELLNKYNWGDEKIE